MVNGEQSWSQRIICLPFTVYCSPPALRSALGALRHEPGPLGPDSLLSIQGFQLEKVENHGNV